MSELDAKVGWSGIYPAAITVFTETGELDDAATAEHVAWLFDQGAHGVVVGGTTGEFVGLDLPERKRLIDLASSAAVGRGPIIVGTGTYSTRDSVALTEYAAAREVAGALIVQPYFQRPSRREVLDHFRAVGQVGMPLVVYNIPANSAAAPIAVDDLVTLHREGVAHAVKSTVPTPGLIGDIRAATDESFRVFYGGIAAPLEGLVSGAHVWVSGLLNVSVPDAVALWDSMQRGDLASAQESWEAIRRMRDVIRRGLQAGKGDIAMYRAVLSLRGRDVGFSRLPLQPLVTQDITRLRDELEQLRSARRVDSHHPIGKFNSTQEVGA